MPLEQVLQIPISHSHQSVFNICIRCRLDRKHLGDYLRRQLRLRESAGPDPDGPQEWMLCKLIETHVPEIAHHRVQLLTRIDKGPQIQSRELQIEFHIGEAVAQQYDRHWVRQQRLQELASGCCIGVSALAEFL
ncbi:MAG: hypothetical protein F4Z92_14165, partial [Gemmatimonadetes bacterium]|nr:hypothetical protein [Gemmatimonadota bacterium]